MVYANTPVQQLTKMRQMRVEERRAIAAGYDEEPQEALAKMVEVQAQIDALDRAIRDEKELAGKTPEDWRNS